MFLAEFSEAGYFVYFPMERTSPYRDSMSSSTDRSELAGSAIALKVTIVSAHPEGAVFLPWPKCNRDIHVELELDYLGDEATCTHLHRNN